MSRRAATGDCWCVCSALLGRRRLGVVVARAARRAVLCAGRAARGNGADIDGGAGNGADIDGGAGNGADIDGGAGTGNGADIDGGAGNGADIDGGAGNGADIDGGAGNGADIDGGAGNGADIDGGADVISRKMQVEKLNLVATMACRGSEVSGWAGGGLDVEQRSREPVRTHSHTRRERRGMQTLR
ncbi:uncharacterized protein LOC126273217 [Schistocerca gregaria]|uniref:uncharacterized protein LOC126273217 n=1 Tax=Schistocerca gregaria TaxID=7010 RepID=UPI00211DEC38|nr:uncharacterized protein LOC126273217 [Schistocerca gregaria]